MRCSSSSRWLAARPSSPTGSCAVEAAWISDSAACSGVWRSWLTVENSVARASDWASARLRAAMRSAVRCSTVLCRAVRYSDSAFSAIVRSTTRPSWIPMILARSSSPCCGARGVPCRNSITATTWSPIRMGKAKAAPPVSHF